MSFRSMFLGFCSGVFIMLSLIVLFTNEIYANTATFTITLAILFSALTWKSIKRDEDEKY